MRPKLPEGFHYELFADATYVTAPNGEIIILILSTDTNPPKTLARFSITSELGHNYQEFDNEENAVNGMLARWRLGISNKKEK